MEPRIHALVAAAAVGTRGERTVIEEPPPCPVCGYAPRSECISLEYVLDSWNGEDFVEALGCYAVSERLNRALSGAGLVGFRIQPMRVSKAEHFFMGEEAYQAEVPSFLQWVVTGKAEGPDTWFETRRCSACGRRSGPPTDAGIEAMMGGGGPPLAVYRDSWRGDDAFRLEFGPPVLTERFVAVLERLKVKDLVLKPAAWADRPST